MLFFLAISFVANIVLVADSSDRYYEIHYWLWPLSHYLLYPLIFFAAGDFVRALFVSRYVSFFLLATTFFCLASYVYTLDGGKLSEGYFRMPFYSISFLFFFVAYSDAVVERRLQFFIDYGVLVAALVMFALLVMWQFFGYSGVNEHNQNLYHEEVYLFAVLPFLHRFEKFRPAMAIIAIAACLLTGKNTGYLVALVIIYYYFGGISIAGFYGAVKTVFFKVMAPALVLLCSAFFYIYNLDAMPSGNVGTRMIAYGVKWSEFMASPVIGSFFYGKSLVDVGWGVIPAHSDILDIMAAGGVLALMLYLYPFFKIVASDVVPDWIKAAIVSFVVVMAVNPLLFNPKNAYFFWLFSAFGFACLVMERRIERA